MFVDHLSHRVAQQHDVLVKRFDLPLQFNAVDEVDRHWDVFAAQGVQERILEQLAFVIVHDILRVQRVVGKVDTIPQGGTVSLETSRNSRVNEVLRKQRDRPWREKFNPSSVVFVGERVGRAFHLNAQRRAGEVKLLAKAPFQKSLVSVCDMLK